MDGHNDEAAKKKGTRNKSYTDAQKEIIKREIDYDNEQRALLSDDQRAKKRKVGYRSILAKYPAMGYTASGLWLLRGPTCWLACASQLRLSAHLQCIP